MFIDRLQLTFIFIMLNRRILRAKAMQHIYAYKQCQRSNRELAFAYVYNTFQPDLNSMEVQDKEKLNRDEKLATSMLKAYFDKTEGPKEIPDSIEQVAREAISQYEKQCRRDQQFLRQQMLSSTERITDDYLLLLLLLAALAEESGRERQKRFNLLSPDTPASRSEVKLNFSSNRIVRAIQHNQHLQDEAKKKGLNWDSYHSDLKQWFRNFVNPDEKLQAYQELNSPSLEEDIEIARHIFNNIILKHDPITAILEENDINWSENKKAIKSMANKSIKSITEDDPDYIELVELTPNWEEDKDFLENLYAITIEYDAEYEHIISEKSKNWSLDRIAALDNIIIKMAIAEMVHFSSIPVKVTINEYVDISKQYSTHKSKHFVNGMLDVIANDLQQKNLIRKSGRGLIDNQ